MWFNICVFVCVCSKQNNPLWCLVGSRRAPQTGSVWAVGRPATKGCMQQATGSAQSINLPMSNLWHSDRQGHRQHGTDIHIQKDTWNQTCIPRLSSRWLNGYCLKGPIYGKCEVFMELSRCQSFECSWGLNVLLTLGKQELAIVSFI